MRKLSFIESDYPCPGFVFFYYGTNLGNMVKETLNLKTKSAQFWEWTELRPGDSQGTEQI